MAPKKNFEKTEKDYLKCCLEPQSKCKAESKPDFTNNGTGSPYFEITSLAIFAALIGGGLYYFLKSEFMARHILPHKQLLKAIGYGWLIWVICVLTYTYLLEIHVEYSAWFTLPPICAIAIYIWVRAFIWKRSNN